MTILKSNSSVEVDIAASGKLILNTLGRATVTETKTYPNYPSTTEVLASLNNDGTTLTFTSATTVVITSGDEHVEYSTGTAPVLSDRAVSAGALNATGALTSALMLGGIVTSTSAAATDGTLPTFAVLTGTTSLSTGDAIEWSVVNTGPSTFTILVAANHTIQGAPAVATATSARFLTLIGASACVTYRIA